EPKVRRKYVIERATLGKGLSGGSDVDVLAEMRVGGFDATVLRARDPEALRAWLEKRGFDARPQLTDWLAPYIKQGWIITAFQIAKKEKESDWLETRAVRMSFKTDRPYFPYREPADQREEGRYRLLRVFLVAPERRAGRLDQARAAWGGHAVWA